MECVKCEERKRMARERQRRFRAKSRKQLILPHFEDIKAQNDYVLSNLKDGDLRSLYNKILNKGDVNDSQDL